MSRKGITEQQFNQAIGLWVGGTDIDKVAKAVGIKPSTVRLVRQCLTWREYCRRKAVKAKKAADMKRQTIAKHANVTSVRHPATVAPQSTAGLAHVLNDAYRDYKTSAEQLNDQIKSIAEVQNEMYAYMKRAIEAQPKRRWFGRK